MIATAPRDPISTSKHLSHIVSTQRASLHLESQPLPDNEQANPDNWRLGTKSSCAQSGQSCFWPRDGPIDTRDFDALRNRETNSYPRESAKRHQTPMATGAESQQQMKTQSTGLIAEGVRPVRGLQRDAEDEWSIGPAAGPERCVWAGHTLQKTGSAKMRPGMSWEHQRSCRIPSS